MFGVYTAFMSNEGDTSIPLGARNVSAPSQYNPFSDDNWSPSGHENQLPGQQRPGQSPLGPFVAVGNGVYMNVVPDPDMRRFDHLDYGSSTFSSSRRTIPHSRGDYQYSRQKRWLYDDDREIETWDSQDYRVQFDDGPPPPIHTSTWPLYDEPRVHHRSLYQDLDDSSGSLKYVASSAEDDGGNKFRRLFDRRRNGRRHETRVNDEEERRPKYADVDVESLDSFELLDSKSDHHTRGEPETLDVLKTYLRKLKKERVKMKKERLEFQRLNVGLHDLLRSWDTAERPTYERAPHTAEGVYFERSYQRDPQFEVPLSAATDPGPCFSYEEPPTPGFPTREDTPLSIDQYNKAWKNAKEASELNSPTTIPWPTRTMRVSDLSRNDGQPIQLHFEYSSRSLPSEISDDAYHLRKWNAFNFFLESFGLKGRYEINDQPDEAEDGTSLKFDIDTRGASKLKLDKLKSQLLQEKLRWHPDRMKRMRLARFSELEAESAKAVWGAIVDASKAYERCLSAISR